MVVPGESSLPAASLHVSSCYKCLCSLCLPNNASSGTPVCAVSLTFVVTMQRQSMLAGKKSEGFQPMLKVTTVKIITAGQKKKKKGCWRGKYSGIKKPRWILKRYCVWRKRRRKVEEEEEDRETHTLTNASKRKKPLQTVATACGPLVRIGIHPPQS